MLRAGVEEIDVDLCEGGVIRPPVDHAQRGMVVHSLESLRPHMYAAHVLTTAVSHRRLRCRPQPTVLGSWRGACKGMLCWDWEDAPTM
jgi:hypothetical protein